MHPAYCVGIHSRASTECAQDRRIGQRDSRTLQAVRDSLRFPPQKEWKGKQQREHSWVFASVMTGSPYSDATILKQLHQARRYESCRPRARLAHAPALLQTLNGRRENQPGADEGPDVALGYRDHDERDGKTLTPEMRAANTLVGQLL